MNHNISSSEEFAKLVRGYSLKMVSRAKASHIGGVLSMADIVAVLYFEILNLFPEEHKHVNRDRLILSKVKYFLSLIQSKFSSTKRMGNDRCLFK